VVEAEVGAEGCALVGARVEAEVGAEVGVAMRSRFSACRI